MEIQIHDSVGDSSNHRKIIKNLIRWICKELDLSIQMINVIFTDDHSLKKMHQEYLDDDTFTDVMTFNLSDSPPIESEIYISIDRAHENAQKFNVTYQSELMRLLIHACLHLAGFDDKDEKTKKIMKAREDFYLATAEKLLIKFL